MEKFLSNLTNRSLYGIFGIQNLKFSRFFKIEFRQGFGFHNSALNACILMKLLSSERVLTVLSESVHSLRRNIPEPF